MTDKTRAPYTLTASLAALMAAQSTLGLLFPGGYRDVEWIKAAWFGNDWVTLVVAAPLLVSGLRLMRTHRGSVQGVLLLLGVVAYAVYNYAFYLFGAALNVFFPLYVLALVLSVATLMVVLLRLDVSQIAASFPLATPVRPIGGYFGLVGVGLGSVWIAIWTGHMFAGRPTPVDPEIFKLVAALDLTLMVPALTFAGALLWRRHKWGYVVGAIAGMQASLYLLVLSVNAIVAVDRGLAKAPGELPMWGTLDLTTIAVTLVLLACVGRTRAVSDGRQPSDPARVFVDGATEGRRAPT